MVKYIYCLLTLFLLSAASAYSQSKHSIKGTITDKKKRESLSYANVLIYGTGMGAITDSIGNFRIEDVPPGIYRLQISILGYKTLITPEYILTTKDLRIDAELEENPTELGEVSVTASTFRRLSESPVGLRIIGLQEIEKSPGANRDISRIVQSYPGVAFSPAGYRNDLIVRGGSPSENRFFLDGVEIPNINHFSTQGASGGPIGIIDADFIREVNFYTGAFPSNKGNALSSVLDFKLRDGSMEKNSLKAALGYSEVSLASNGHIGKKTSYLVSVRQSYLQFLFKALGLPFLPTFTDAQFKIKTRFSAHHELTVLGIGGIDNMRLNTDEKGEKAEYLLSYLPKIQQETFTLGGVYKHYAGNHVQTAVVSHSYLNNRNTKYVNNDESNNDNLSLKIRSIEQETKLRMENSSTFGQWKANVGVNLDYTQYNNTSYQKVFIKQQEQIVDYYTNLDLIRWGFFGTMTYETQDERFTASLGIRGDANNYSSKMNKLYKQLSPRLSLSYRLIDNIYLSGNIGRYFQLPPYTALGFKKQNTFINRDLKYTNVDQASIGLSYRLGEKLQASVEGFYKLYHHVPLSVADSIPLACKGNDYGVIGNEELISTARGRSYGVEFLLKWMVAGKFNLASSFTLFKSEYRNGKQSDYVSSAWDNRYIFNVSGTYNFNHNWSFGAKVSCIGGAPYTPYDSDKSSLIDAWNAQGRPYYDYNQYNTKRLPAFGQLDIRVDKSFYIKKYMLGFYIDLQNITNSKFKQPDVLMSTGAIDPNDNKRYIMKRLEQKSGTILPTLGITFEL
ncbi:MAG: TonB-dependent receptor [Bacteroidaceae bacterium]